jgi:hypothetical protein
MPYLNSIAEWCSGKAGSGVYWGFVGSQEIHTIKQPGEGGSANWLNQNNVAYQTWPPARVEAANVMNGEITPISPNPVNADVLLTSQSR